MAVHSWNSSTPEAETEGSQFRGQPELHCESSVSKEAEGDRGKVECVKCLPHTHKDLSPDHKHHIEKPDKVVPFLSALGRQRQEHP